MKGGISIHLLPHLANETSRDYSLRVLRYNIITTEMKPGQMYSEKELSSALGLSRTPMREALIDLAKIKIVEVYPQRGTAVALIDYDTIAEASFMREALEVAAIRLCCETASPRQLATLELNVRQQKIFRDSGHMDELMRLDNSFHAAIFRIANKSLSYSMLSTMTLHFDRVRFLAVESVSDFKFIDEHESMLEALRAQDADEAGRLMHHHLHRYEDDAIALQKVYPRYFKPVAKAND